MALDKQGKKVGIIGVPLGYGAEKTGSELGVESIRSSPIRGKLLIDHIRDLGYDVRDIGNVEIVKPTATAAEESKAKYLHELAASCSNIAEAVRGVLADNRLPVILGGDHSIAIGSFSGIASHFREHG